VRKIINDTHDKMANLHMLEANLTFALSISSFCKYEMYASSNLISNYSILDIAKIRYIIFFLYFLWILSHLFLYFPKSNSVKEPFSHQRIKES